MPEIRRPSGYLVMGGLRVLSSGVDTLHFSVRGELQEGLLVFLEALKREAQTSKELQVVTWGEQSLSVALRPHGWRSYPFWASSPNIEVAIGAPSPFPPVFIQTHSACLLSRGAHGAQAEISKWLAASVMRSEPQLGISRLDLYCDTRGWSPAVDDFDRLHCRRVCRRVYSTPARDQAHLRGRRPSGFDFGGGDLMARCYYKARASWEKWRFPPCHSWCCSWRTAMARRSRQLVLGGPHGLGCRRSNGWGRRRPASRESGRGRAWAAPKQAILTRSARMVTGMGIGHEHCSGN